MIFVTGTDTEIGKTHISQALLYGWKETRGTPASIRKPVLSGDLGFDNDALRLIEASGTHDSIETVAPHRYEEAVSPDLAIRNAGESISIKTLTKLCAEADLIEGAGGFLSPICSDGLNADLAEQLKPSLIVTIGLKLGCINHALLTLNEAHRRGIYIHSVIINALEIEPKNLAHTRATIEKYQPTKARIYQTPFHTDYKTLWSELKEQGFIWPVASKS